MLISCSRWLLRSALIGSVALASPVFAATTAHTATTHEVLMLNRDDTGIMAYQPDYLRINTGDTVRFIPTTLGHNAASINTFWPQGAAFFKSRLNDTFDWVFETPGRYGIQCTPHYAMGMVMLIDVIDADAQTPLPTLTLPDGLPRRAAVRFKQIIKRHQLE